MEILYRFEDACKAWIWRLLHPPIAEIKFTFDDHRDESLMFIRTGRGDSVLTNAEFVPEIKAWCKANVKKKYKINGRWDTSTYMLDFVLKTEYTVSFRSDKDAALFKLFWYDAA